MAAGNSVLAEAGYDLLISMMSTPEDRRRFLREARSFCRRVDGIVLIDTFASAEGGSASTYFNRPVVAVPEQRRLGYEDALHDAGLSIDPSLAAQGDGLADGGALALSALIDRPDPPTAVFCMTDEMAFGALEAARNTGLSVPADLSVIGFDDHDLSAALGLTTMCLSVSEMGVRAAEQVLALIDGLEPPSDITWDVPCGCKSFIA